MFAHDNKTLGTQADFLHDSSLSGIWLAKYRVQSRHTGILRFFSNCKT